MVSINPNQMRLFQQTAMLQLARQQAQDHPEDEDHQERIQEVKQK